jgi:hypothetical protein
MAMGPPPQMRMMQQPCYPTTPAILVAALSSREANAPQSITGGFEVRVTSCRASLKWKTISSAYDAFIKS